MLLQLIDDINRALDNECYFSALALALTLPDICGQAMSPNKSVKERYVCWYDEFVGKYEEPIHNNVPYLSGEVVYNLRCNFLHQGNPIVNKEKVKDKRCQIDKFSLILSKQNCFGIYPDAACYSESGENCAESRIYDVNVRRLCFILTACAKGYFEKHSAQFGFSNYSIIYDNGQ